MAYEPSVGCTAVLSSMLMAASSTLAEMPSAVLRRGSPPPLRRMIAVRPSSPTARELVSLAFEASGHPSQGTFDRELPSRGPTMGARVVR
jgi:hypothetical protein